MSVEVSSHVHIIRRLQGKEKKKKPNHFALVQRPDGTGRKTQGFSEALGGRVCCDLQHILPESSAAER